MPWGCGEYTNVRLRWDLSTGRSEAGWRNAKQVGCSCAVERNHCRHVGKWEGLLGKTWCSTWVTVLRRRKGERWWEYGRPEQGGLGAGAFYSEWKSKQAGRVAPQVKPGHVHSSDRTTERWEERINTTKLSFEHLMCTMALMPYAHNSNVPKSGATKLMRQTEIKQIF